METLGTKNVLTFNEACLFSGTFQKPHVSTYYQPDKSHTLNHVWKDGLF